MAPTATVARIGLALGVLAQVSTDDLTNLINDSIVALAVGLPVAAMVLIALVYVMFLWEVSRWWRAAVVSGAVALALFGLAALGGRALRNLGIAAMLDAVNTPTLAAVTSLPLAAALLRGGLAFGALAVGLGVLGIVRGSREPLDVDALVLSPGEQRTVRFVAESLSPGERTRDCTALELTATGTAAVVLHVSHVLDEESGDGDPSDLEARAWLDVDGSREYLFGDAERHGSLSDVVETGARVSPSEAEPTDAERRFCFELVRPEDATGQSDEERFVLELTLEPESRSTSSDEQSGTESEAAQ